MSSFRDKIGITEKCVQGTIGVAAYRILTKINRLHNFNFDFQTYLDFVEICSVSFTYLTSCVTKQKILSLKNDKNMSISENFVFTLTSGTAHGLVYSTTERYLNINDPEQHLISDILISTGLSLTSEYITPLASLFIPEHTATAASVTLLDEIAIPSLLPRESQNSAFVFFVLPELFDLNSNLENSTFSKISETIMLGRIFIDSAREVLGVRGMEAIEDF